jgi:UDP-glucose 4-epimerase
MKILITGVAGLLGSRLSDYIIENHTNVYIVGIDDMSGGYKENVNSKVELWEMNLVNGNVEECFERHQFDYVYHFAAYAAEGLSPFIRTYNYQNNLVATSRIITQCIKHNVKRLVFTSTLAVYGHQDGNIFDEKLVPKPIDPYGVAKYGCEMDIQIAGEQHGLDWCIIRPHNVYGVKQNVWDKYRNVLGIWMYQHTINEPMTIFGDGTQTRAFSYIDDSLEPLWKASQDKRASKEIINLGGIKEYSIIEANEILREVVGGGEVKYFEGRHEVKNSVPTWQKSIDLLDFEHKTDLKEGLTKMWGWVKTQPIRERFVWPFYELDKGIYSFWKNN